MKKRILKKSVVILIMLLFMGMSIVPAGTIGIKQFTVANLDEQDAVDSSEGLLSRGHIAYAIGSFENCSGLLEWDLDDLDNFTCICNGIPFYSAGTWTHHYGRIYVVDTIGNLIEIDLETCNQRYIGHTGTGELVTLAYDPSSDTLYGGSSQNLYEIDMETGKATYIGPFQQQGYYMISIDCDRYGNMYGIELNFGTCYFYSINTSTGHATQIGPTGVSMIFNSHMAYDKDYDTIYAIVFNYHTWLLEFHTINVTTGAMTLVDVFPPDRQFSVFTIPYYYLNQPPNAPIITGQIHGKVRVEYQYSFSLSDPDGNSMHLRVDWGNGTPSPWQGPYDSDTTVKLNHTWYQKGTYTIRAQAKDVCDLESDWGELEVTMPKNKSLLGMGIVPATGTIDIKQSTVATTLDGNTLYVGGNGTGNYTKIQDAIDDATDGDTVFVYNGTYYENIEVNKSINLIGEDRDTTEIIHNWEDYYVVTISVDLVNINGFTILIYDFGGCISLSSCNNNVSGNIIKDFEGLKGDEEIGIGFSENSNNNTITGNIILDHMTGIYLSDSSNNIIKNNNFSGNWYSIDAYDSNNNTIKDNNFPYNVHGIILQENCMNNTITGNTLLNTSCCTGIGIESSSNSNTISNNTIISGGWCGIIIQYSSDNTVIGNTILNWEDGVYLWDSSNNTISCNNINCRKHGIRTSRPLIKEYGIYRKCPICDNNNNHHFYSSNNNTIHHNNFINNKQNAYDGCDNTWDNGYPSGGNFWDDYNGTDEDEDGIGDTPYPIPGGDNEDRYPLMELYGNWTLSPFARFTWLPSLPDPNETILFNASESIDYDGNITLYEWDWDNDGEFDENHTNSTATHLWPNYGYYPVTLRVTDNDNLTDCKTKTVRVGNQPPYEPSNPDPSGEFPVDINVNLSWDGGDPDPSDTVTYDVYFGRTIPPPKVASNVTEYNPGILNFYTTYYWKIVAWDNHGASTEGPIWSFTTYIPSHPEVEIVNPREGYFHYSGIPLFAFKLLPALTIGGFKLRPIQVNANSEYGEVWVQLYIDDKDKGPGTWNPETGYYEWQWTERALGIYNLIVIARDIHGLESWASLDVINFCLWDSFWISL